MSRVTPQERVITETRTPGRSTGTDEGGPYFSNDLLLGGEGGRVNQQPPMNQLAVLSTGWAAFFHSLLDVVHHSSFLFLFAADHYIFIFILGSSSFFPSI